MSKIINHLPDNRKQEIEWLFVDHPVYPGMMIMKRRSLIYKVSEKTGKPLPASKVTTEDTMAVTPGELPALAEAVTGADLAHSKINRRQLKLERTMKD